MSEDNLAYLEDGCEIEVLERTAHGIIIRRLYESGDGEGEAGDPEIVARVFDAPPTERRAKHVKDLESQESQLRASIQERRKELVDLDSNKKRIALLAAKNAALGRVCDFMEGKITHYLMKHWSGYAIVAAEPGGGIPDKNDSGRIEGTKLLTLFGKSEGNFSWGLNDYHDGSGDNRECEPFFSLDEAKAKLQGIVDAYETSPKHFLVGLVNAAQGNGLIVPAGLAQAAAQQELSAAEGGAAEAQKKLSEAEARSKAVREKWAWAVPTLAETRKP